MHGAIEIDRQRRGLLRDRGGGERVDGVGAGVDELRDLDAARRRADRAAHREIAHQAAGIAALVRRQGRQEHEHVARDAAARRAALPRRLPRGRARASRAQAPRRRRPHRRASRRPPRKPPAPSTTTRAGFCGLVVCACDQASFWPAPAAGAPRTKCSRPRRPRRPGLTSNRDRSRRARAAARQCRAGSSARNCGHGVMIDERVGAVACRERVVGDCHARMPLRRRPHRRVEHGEPRSPQASLISASAGEFLMEWVFSL